MKEADRQRAFEKIDLTGKTIVFTGGTDGMGVPAVKKLAKMGATIMLLGRNEAKTKAVVTTLNVLANKENVHYVHCDLASQASIRQAAEIVLSKCPTIDLLINCAGANFDNRRLNEEGFELDWAVNHLAPFLLTHLLLGALQKAPKARIIHLSSATQKYGHIHLNDLQLKKGWSTLAGYAQAKLALNMVTRKLAKELVGTNITVNALNPGFIKTNLTREATGWKALVTRIIEPLFAEKTEIGGDRILRLALSPEFEGVTGQFIYEDAARDPNPEALNDELVEKIWKIFKEHTDINSYI